MDEMIFVPAKTSNNYCIYSKDKKRIRFQINGVYLPYGKEQFNDGDILNVIIDDSSNYGYNMIIKLNQIVEKFEELKKSYVGKIKYNINDKEFFSFMKKLDETDPLYKENVNTHQIRAYLKYGAKITHSKHIGELGADYPLAKKRCNIELELGSMWSSDNKFGVNIYVTSIVVK